ncbi:MAG TPA: ATP-binding protein [Terracidiphilus sp.]|nr:ATP-binding protein [Terracidiphilus sp.]
MIQGPNRFLIVAPVGRDGKLIGSFLNACGYSVESFSSIGEISLDDSADVCGLVMTDEALRRDGFTSLRALLDGQSDWSDLPLILLTGGPAESRNAQIASRVRLEFRSVFLLDRPVRKEMLLSAVQVAYNSRLRQLQVRDATAKQYRSDETLRNTEKLATAGKLAATLAHEINNPLEALQNLLFLVENSATLQDALPFIRMATQEVHRIQEITDLTLRLHRAPSVPSLNDLSEIAASALMLFRARLRSRRIVECAEMKPVMAWCSAGEVRQAVVNLIGNAVDAMPDGGELHLRVSNVSKAGIDFARLTIADTGSGIPAEIRPNLFRQFFTTKGSRGTGLGLWLTQDIMRRNRGSLRFRSRTSAPAGTVFSMYLPVTAPVGVVDDGELDSKVSIEAA